MKIKHIVFIIVLLLVSLAYCFFVLNKTTVEPKSEIFDSATESILPPSEIVWETFNDSDYNFSFEYPKGAFFGKDFEDYTYLDLDLKNFYLEIIEIDPSSPAIIGNTPAYWLKFLLFPKSASTENICDDSLVKYFDAEEFVYTKDVFDRYEIYKGVAKDAKYLTSESETICFERPNYTLFIYGNGDTSDGYEVMKHIMSSVRFGD